MAQRAQKRDVPSPAERTRKRTSQRTARTRRKLLHANDRADRDDRGDQDGLHDARTHVLIARAIW